MIYKSNIKVIIKLTTKKVFNIKLLSKIIYINFILLHDYLKKLNIT